MPATARFREVVYRLVARRPLSATQLPLMLCAGSPSLVVETTVAHLDERGAIWRILHARGDPPELATALARFRAFRAEGLVEKQVLGRTRHSAILWYKYRARTTRTGFSNTALAFRALGRDTVITDAARHGELTIRILCRADRDVRGFLAKVRARAAADFDLQVAYTGPPRAVRPTRLTPAEDRLLSSALQAGYFGVPRTASAASVGRLVGRSASAVSAALRRIVEKLARGHLGLW